MISAGVRHGRRRKTARNRTISEGESPQNVSPKLNPERRLIIGRPLITFPPVCPVFRVQCTALCSTTDIGRYVCNLFISSAAVEAGNGRGYRS